MKISKANIKLKLKQSSMRIRDLAAYCGTSPEQASRWLNGVHAPPWVFPFKAAEFLRVGIDEIVEGWNPASHLEARIANAPIAGKISSTRVFIQEWDSNGRICNTPSHGLKQVISNDPDVFALMVSDGSLEPIFHLNGLLIISPRAGFQQQGYHFVKLNDGTCWIRRVRKTKLGFYCLDLPIPSCEPLDVAQSEIDLLWPISQVISNGTN